VENKQEAHVYRIQGLTCTNCAQKFENNVKKISGVTDAKVNFGASKVSVSGAASISDIEKAGAFDNIKVSPEQEEIPVEMPVPFYKKHATVLLSFLFLIAGWIAYFQQGEGHITTTLLFAVSIVVGGYRLFISGLNNLVRLQFDMKTLMTIAIIGAAIIGEWGEGATVVILFAISEALESYSMEKARASIRSLMNVSPKQATILIEGKEQQVPVRDIRIGDRMLVKPGQKIAMDGKILKGSASISEAAITGESIPVAKGVEDEVFAGTFNEDGLLEVEVTKRVEDTTISKIIHLVEEAQAERAPSQAFVDKFAKYYTPLIIIIAFLVATVPPLLLASDWNTWIYQGLAVLVVGCPCALVISTPIAIVTAIGNAARNGVLIKGGVFLEEVGRIKAIAFDKTGTLTKGAHAVADVAVTGEDGRLISEIRAALRTAADPLKAEPMRAYMKSEMPFLGVQKPDRVRVLRPAFRAHVLPDRSCWESTIRRLWDDAAYREERYAATDLAQVRCYAPWTSDPASLPLYDHLIVSGAWWDHVDDIAIRLVGRVLRAHPVRTAPLIRAWSRDPDRWRRRSAVICQVGCGEETDVELLRECVLATLDDPDFFLRKGIGWALRQHAKTDPTWVRTFVSIHGDRLSPLSRREALKHLVRLT
jgi:3-methyladenine DNA glycosylase AlkD/copper chaperone CopZ